MKKFAASVPRKMLWSTDVGGTDTCPECHGKLEQERHSYLMLTREGKDNQQFIVGNEHGYFCDQCPVVVLDYEAFAEKAMACNPSSSSFEFMVPGIIDFDAIPEDKADIPLGDDDNPIPLMRFTNYEDTKPYQRNRRRNRFRKAQRKRKRRR